MKKYSGIRQIAMPVDVNVKGIREGLLISFGEGSWEDAFPSLLSHLDSKPDFFLGANAIVQLGAFPLQATDLARLRSALLNRGMGLRTVLSQSPVTVSAAKNLGLEVSLPVREARETPLDAELTGSDAMLLHQSLRSGNSVHFPGHVTILGNVDPGAEIVAGGSVFVWGHLRGTVHAGAEGDDRSVVCALDLSPMQLRIAGYVAASSPRSGSSRPEIASLRDGQLVAETWNPKEKPPTLAGG
jgi:septum site-determining protein MinC